jgi:hypothetical protein
MKHLTPVWFGIMLSSGLIAASAIAAPTVSSPDRSESQHLIAAEANSLASESSLAQSTQLADVLTGIIAFGLPCSLLFAVLLHNQLAAQRDRLAAQLVPIRVKSKS